jgi:hypothetical protein
VKESLREISYILSFTCLEMIELLSRCSIRPPYGAASIFPLMLPSLISGQNERFLLERIFPVDYYF